MRFRILASLLVVFMFTALGVVTYEDKPPKPKRPATSTTEQPLERGLKVN